MELYSMYAAQYPEQKMALAAYSTEGDNLSLTPNQLELIGKVIAVQDSLEEITKSISTDAASVSPLKDSQDLTLIVEYEQWKVTR